MTTTMPGAVPGLHGPGAHVPPQLGPLLPRYGEPGWTVWPRRIWPIDPLAAAPRRFLIAAAVAGLVGTGVWRPSVLSVGYLVVGVLAFAVIYATAGRRPGRVEAVGVCLTLALLAVPAVLAAPWLGVLCIMAAWVLGWCTLFGGRTWTAIVTAPFLAWALGGRVAGWVRRGMPDALPPGAAVPRLGRAALVIGLTVVLTLAFGALFASADPAFAHLAGNLVPAVDALDVVARTVTFGIVLAFVLGGGYLVRFQPRLDAMAPARGRPLPSWEWALPLGALDVLFVAFVVVQATVLFGGHTHVLQTEGLTYAEYARQGFWQLLGVSALTMLVLGAVIRLAARESARDRATLRVLVGILCVTSVAVVISAIHRMWVYQQAYGFSTERLMVITFEAWLGAVFVLVLVAGVQMTGRWLPRAVLVAGVAALLGLAALNPERLIADRNIDRYEQTGRLDARYLSGLSSDIDPALSRLPDPVRACVTGGEPADRAWYLFNLSASRANRPEEVADPTSCLPFRSDLRDYLD